jgi:tetratricopeptide (TPR) repeat protein
MSHFAGPPPILVAIDRALGRNDMAEAMALARQALDQGLRDSTLLGLRAYWHESQGRFSEAVEDLQQARRLAPRDARLLNAMGRCLTELGRAEDALAALEAALSIEPNLARAHYNRGLALERQGMLVPAAEAHSRALALEPAMADALSRLASLAARRGDWEDARRLAARVLAVEPDNPVALLAQARAALAARDFLEAERAARAAVASRRALPLASANALVHLGDALDRQNRPAEAFAAYTAGKETEQAIFAARFASEESGIDLAGRLTDALQAGNARDWAQKPLGQAPVFLLGFPRSGTTLLGQILAAHPKIQVLEEQPLLKAVVEEQLLPEGGVSRLATLSQGERERYRALFWSGAGGAGDYQLVDQGPFNTLYLPAIAALFPGAQVIFALRDPRDVVFSCFRQSFVMHRFTFEFLSLERAATFYSRTMRLAETARTRLPLRFHDVRNEDLIGDFDGTVRSLCDALGIAWNSAMAGFAGAARGRAIATPSAAQVAGGLSNEGIGRWRRYEKQLAPVLPVLEPWVKRFGYEPS